MYCDQQNKLSAYADNELTGFTALKLKMHLRKCAECRDYLAMLKTVQRSASTALAQEMEASDVIDSVMESIRPLHPKTSGFRWKYVTVASACAFLAIAFCTWPRHKVETPIAKTDNGPQIATNIPEKHLLAVVESPRPVDTGETPRHVDSTRKPIHRRVRHRKKPSSRRVPAMMAEVCKPRQTDNVTMETDLRIIETPASESESGGILQTTVSLVVQDVSIYQMTYTVLTLKPNDEAQDIERPQLSLNYN